MKRILLACFLLTATCAFVSVQYAVAQSTPQPVTKTAFIAKVNAMDAYIASGDMTNAQATWNDIHEMMISVLGVTKGRINNATNDPDRDHYMDEMKNQRTYYSPSWEMHTDLATNRAALKTSLTGFGGTIY